MIPSPSARDSPLPRPALALAVVIVLAATGVSAAPAEKVRPSGSAGSSPNPCAAAFKAREFEKALACYRGAAARNAKDIDARNGAAAALLSLERYGEALDEFEAVLKAAPGNPVAMNGRAVSFLGMSRVPEGMKALEEAIRSDPENVQALNNLALLALQAGEIRIAERVYGQALAVKSDDEDAHAGLGEIRLRQGMLDEALRHLEAALKKNRDNARALWLAGKALAQTDAVAALPYLERAAGISPGVAAVVYDLGLVRYATGDVRAAGSAFTEFLRLAPNDPAAYFYIGKCYLDQFRYADAQVFLAQALRKRPPKALEASIEFHRAVAFERQDRWKEAEENYRRVLEIDPTFASARCNLGSYYFAHARYEDALSEYDAALEIDPQLHEARFGRVVSRLQAKRPDEIEEDVAALRGLPSSHPVRVRLDRILANKGMGGLKPIDATRLPEKPSLEVPKEGP